MNHNESVPDHILGDLLGATTAKKVAEKKTDKTQMVISLSQIHWTTKQTTNQSTKQTTDQPINQPAYKPANQPTNKPANQSTSDYNLGKKFGHT